MKEKNRVLTVCLVISLIFNAVFALVFLKNWYDMNSYEGTWKCSSNPLYEITIFVDYRGTFYEAVFPVQSETTVSGITITNNMPKLVYKGYIEKNALVYTGVKTIKNGDSFEYLSDIPEDQYEKASYYYTITRNSKNTMMLEIPGDTKTKYTFVKAE